MSDAFAHHELYDIAPRRLAGAGSLRRAIDVAVAALALSLLAVVALVLLVLNPLFNPGPLLYRQTRMGRRGEGFSMLKFRSMRTAAAQRTFDAPLEVHRITPLGAWLRRTRLDELPQIVNVLRGEMSLIGPRPDAWDHAKVFLERVPDYRRRLTVRPGMTGLAQVELGYAEGLSATAEKVGVDLSYIRGRTWQLDAAILWRTVKLVAAAGGR
ncbi:MAG: sugar transferase [Pseudomonadota bacterium]